MPKDTDTQIQMIETSLSASHEVNSRLRVGKLHADGQGYCKVQPAGGRLGSSIVGSRQIASKMRPAVVKKSTFALNNKYLLCRWQYDP